jgi:hypothetical protein
MDMPRLRGADTGAGTLRTADDRLPSNAVLRPRQREA